MKKLLIYVAVLSMVCAGAAQAVPITVENYSFDLPGTIKQICWDGEVEIDPINNPGVYYDDVPGWTDGPAVAGDSGVEESPWAAAWIGYICLDDSPVWNLTEYIISAGEDFTLTLDSGSGGSGRSIIMGLYYDDGTTRQSLGSVTNSVPQLSMDEFSMTVSATTASVGYPIGIELASPKSYIGMDNVRLDVIPEPATMALLGLGSLALLKRRRA
jgi:PEP-CTERM motif